MLCCTSFLVEECWVVIVVEAGWPNDGRLAPFRFKEWMPGLGSGWEGELS